MFKKVKMSGELGQLHPVLFVPIPPNKALSTVSVLPPLLNIQRIMFEHPRASAQSATARVQALAP